MATRPDREKIDDVMRERSWKVKKK